MKNLKIVYLIFALLVIGSVIFSNSSSMGIKSDDLTTKMRESDRSPIFEDEQLKIAFDLPLTYLGTSNPFTHIETRNLEEPGNNYQVLTGRTLYLNTIDDQLVFLHANITDHAPTLGRGAYWGDEGMKITSQEAVQKFCSNRINCTIHTNSYGVVYAKWYQDYTKIYTGDMGRFSTLYFLYNPHSDFNGVVISDDGWKKYDIFPEYQKGIESLVENVRFLSE